jgi:hypothetical protein
MLPSRTELASFNIRTSIYVQEMPHLIIESNANRAQTQSRGLCSLNIPTWFVPGPLEIILNALSFSYFFRKDNSHMCETR